MDLGELYQEIILDHNRSPRNKRGMDGANVVEAEGHNPLCGDRVTVRLKVEGGVVVGFEMARQLGTESIFAERVEGRFVLRRGFDIPGRARVLMVEDVVTTGLSSRECIDCIRENGGEVVAAASLVDRSGGQADLGVTLVSLLAIEVPTFAGDALPAELAAIPAVKPGSRHLAQAKG